MNCWDTIKGPILQFFIMELRRETSFEIHGIETRIGLSVDRKATDGIIHGADHGSAVGKAGVQRTDVAIIGAAQPPPSPNARAIVTAACCRGTSATTSTATTASFDATTTTSFWTATSAAGPRTASMQPPEPVRKTPKAWFWTWSQRLPHR